MQNKNFKKMFDLFNIFDDLFIQDFYNLNNKNKGDWKEQKFTSPDGSFVFSYYTRTLEDEKGDKNTNEIDSLKLKLNEAVECQNFEEAVELRDKIKKLEKNQNEIKELNDKLKNCIDSQDFETAIELRDKIKKLTN